MSPERYSAGGGSFSRTGAAATIPSLTPNGFGGDNLIAHSDRGGFGIDIPLTAAVSVGYTFQQPEATPPNSDCGDSSGPPVESGSLEHMFELVSSLCEHPTNRTSTPLTWALARVSVACATKMPQSYGANAH